MNNAISSGEAVKNVRVDFMWWCTLLAIDFRRQRQADLSLVYIGNSSLKRGETQPQKENENVKERKRMEGAL